MLIDEKRDRTGRKVHINDFLEIDQIKHCTLKTILFRQVDFFFQTTKTVDVIFMFLSSDESYVTNSP